MRRFLLCTVATAMFLPALAAAEPALCPGDNRDYLCWNYYYECIPECEGKNGSYTTCANQYCAELRDNCLYGFVISQNTTYPIVSKTSNGCSSVCTSWTCYCGPAEYTHMRSYDVLYNETTTRRRRCCPDITGDWCPSGDEYDDVTIIPHDRECFKHDDQCNWWNRTEATCIHHGCYINDDDTIRFTIYQ